jgi:hypothetical protein
LSRGRRRIGCLRQNFVRFTRKPARYLHY